MDNSSCNCSFSCSNASPVAGCATLSFLDSDKEPAVCARAAEATTQHKPVANPEIIRTRKTFRSCQMPIANLDRLRPRRFNWQSEIGNWKFLLLGHLRRMRTVFLKHTRRRKFTRSEERRVGKECK